MFKASTSSQPLVSVIIPCFNHGHFLARAVESVLTQSYPYHEIIVVDDGSSDNTAAVAKSFEKVRYVYQQNSGLSAARNTGIVQSQGEFVVFLDADDWLYKEALAINVAYLQQNEEAAFVSGAYDNIYEHKIEECQFEIKEGVEPYNLFLSDNYIGMIAAVLFRREVLEEFKYDTTLAACEDYDLYLKISRKYKVIHHIQKIAAYRRHGTNMSNNRAVMVASMLQVIKKHAHQLKSNEEKRIYRKTYNALYYQFHLANAVDKHKYSPLFKKDYFTYYRQYIMTLNKKIASKAKNLMPSFLMRRLKSAGIYNNYLPKPGKVSMGDFDRVTPFSKEFGFDRGGAIDRYYIENFLARESKYITGRALEIGDNYYTMQYGKAQVTKSDILHIDDSNKQATFIGDISNAPQIEDNTFDCIILTQTLHLIYNFKEALHTCFRILKPNGTLLLTVPGITPVDYGEWNATWYWSFTDKAIKKLFADTFPAGEVDVNTYGNVYAASTFLYGMGLTEVDKEKLDITDLQYPVIITVKAIKKV